MKHIKLFEWYDSDEELIDGEPKDDALSVLKSIDTKGYNEKTIEEIQKIINDLEI